MFDEKDQDPFLDNVPVFTQKREAQEILLLKRSIERSAVLLRNGKSTIVSVPGILDMVDFDTAVMLVADINSAADKKTGVFAYLKRNKSKVNLLTKFAKQRKARKPRPRKETLGGLPVAILEAIKMLPPFKCYVLHQSEVAHSLNSIKTNIFKYTPYKSKTFLDVANGFLIIYHLGDYAAAHAAGNKYL